MAADAPTALWKAIHHERTSMAEDLARLSAEQWTSESLCEQWSTEDVVAHLSAAATTGTFGWIRSMVSARFDADLHNQRLLEQHRGATHAETLERFRRTIEARTAAAGFVAAGLGEVVVHAQDIRRPLNITTTPKADSVNAVLKFFLRMDFTVNTRSAARGLRLVADDIPFESGRGPLVRGTGLALAMALAGRDAYCAELEGDGVPVLRERTAI